MIDPGDGGDYAPTIDPADFSDVVDNPFMPLLPGARWVYEERSTDGEVTEVVVEVLDERRTVMGVSTIVVHDVASVDGEVVEDTYDWFAQDSAGNVWYFGEDTTAVRRRRHVQHEGRLGGRRRRRPAGDRDAGRAGGDRKGLPPGVPARRRPRTWAR